MSSFGVCLTRGGKPRGQLPTTSSLLGARVRGRDVRVRGRALRARLLVAALEAHVARRLAVGGHDRALGVELGQQEFVGLLHDVLQGGVLCVRGCGRVRLE